MLPLLTCSVIALAVAIERFFFGPSRERVIPNELLNDAKQLIATKRIEELIGLCRANSSPLARILLVALRNASRSREELTDAVQVVGKSEAFKLQKNIGVLGTIAAVSPLLGLLGTVFGMIRTFHVISEHGTGNPALMAGGIAEALITTATGLTIAVPSLLLYRYFLYQARRLVVEMEVICLNLIDEIQSGLSVIELNRPSTKSEKGLKNNL